MKIAGDGKKGWAKREPNPRSVTSRANKSMGIGCGGEHIHNLIEANEADNTIYFIDLPHQHDVDGQSISLPKWTQVVACLAVLSLDINHTGPVLCAAILCHCIKAAAQISRKVNFIVLNIVRRPIDRRIDFLYSIYYIISNNASHHLHIWYGQYTNTHTYTAKV